MWRLLTICCFLVWLSLPVFSQTGTYTVHCTVNYHNQKLALDKSYWNSSVQDSIRITTCRFYLSQLSFWFENKKVYDFPKKHYLMDVEDEESLNLKLPLDGLPEFDEFHFILGVDSETNAGGAQGQDLDPINGMYWAWQSGYIHVKLEGTSMACTTRNHEFQYHLGGFEFPNNTVQHVILPANKNHQPELILPLDDFFHYLDIRAKANIMSPGQEAVEMSKRFAHLFFTR